MQTIRRFLADESGATAIEYGLIAAGDRAGHHRRGQQFGLDVEAEVRFDQLVAEVERALSSRLNGASQSISNLD